MIKIYYLIARWEQFENVRVLIIPYNHGIKIKTQEICNQFRFYSVAFEKMKKTIQPWEFPMTTTVHYRQIHYIRGYEKSNLKSYIIGKLYVKILTV